MGGKESEQQKRFRETPPPLTNFVQQTVGASEPDWERGCGTRKMGHTVSVTGQKGGKGYHVRSVQGVHVAVGESDGARDRHVCARETAEEVMRTTKNHKPA